MQPGEALGIAAQVAITLAGFAGIVVVFRPDSVHQWSRIDRFRLRLLLANSALPLGYSLFAMLLMTAGLSDPVTWRWCSGVTLICQFGFMLSTSKMGRSISAEATKSVNRLLYFSMATLGSVAMVLQLVNVFRLATFWPFFAAIFVHLIAAIAQFLRLVLLPPHSANG